MEVSKILKAISGVSVAVLGDVMLDRYLTGRVDRISPEAPIPVLLHEATESRLGGAANVALNLNNLARQVQLISMVGKDEKGRELIQLLQSRGINTHAIIQSANRKTTSKTRVMAGWQHLLRVDSEEAHDVDDTEQTALLEALQSAVENSPPEALLLQDYNKGILTTALIKEILAYTKDKGIKTFVDPKDNNFWEYKEVYVFKPNLIETRSKLPFELDLNEHSLKRAATYIQGRLECQHVVLTLGAEGMFVLHASGTSHWVRAPKVEVADVCGAGDTAVSALTLAMAAGVDLYKATEFATLCASLVCKIPGVVPIDARMLHNETNY